MNSNKPRPAFLKIAKGLNEALTVARGETEPARVHLVEPGRDVVQRLREPDFLVQ